MKTVACEMVLKCKNHQVPTHIWVKVNLLYAKILLKNNKPGKAILILKCMAKVLPPIPFAEIPYTKLLQRSENLQDLATAYMQTIESYSAYNYGTYKNSFVNQCFDAREFSQKLVGEEAAPVPVLFTKNPLSRRQERAVSERISELRYYKKKKTELVDEKEMEKENNTPCILGVQIPNLTDFKPLSVCSDSTFLYKIAKISYVHNICIQDGICAIKDYIELIKFEKNPVEKEKRKRKAEKIKSALCQIIKD